MRGGQGAGVIGMSREESIEESPRGRIMRTSGTSLYLYLILLGLGTQFTCFTGTKVQILTQLLEAVMLRCPRAKAWGGFLRLILKKPSRTFAERTY